MRDPLWRQFELATLRHLLLQFPEDERRNVLGEVMLRGREARAGCPCWFSLNCDTAIRLICSLLSLSASRAGAGPSALPFSPALYLHSVVVILAATDETNSSKRAVWAQAQGRLPLEGAQVGCGSRSSIPEGILCGRCDTKGRCEQSAVVDFMHRQVR